MLQRMTSQNDEHFKAYSHLTVTLQIADSSRSFPKPK